MNTGENPGKNRNVIGFVLSLVAIVLGGWLMGALYMSAGKWVALLVLALPIAAIVYSAKGMKTSKAAGFKAGLGVAGLVIGIVAAVWLLFAFMGLAAVDSMAGADGFKELMENAKSLEDLKNLN